MTKRDNLSILMFPWLAHGHISPYLELSKKLSQRKFTIYLCSTPATLNSIKEKIDSFSAYVKIIELNLPTAKLDPEFHTTNGLPPQLMNVLKESFELSKPEFEKILKNLKPDLLIYDFLQPWAPAAAFELGIPAVEFITSSATMMAFYFHQLKNPGVKFPYSAIFYHDYEIVRKKKLLEGLSEEEINERRRALQECHERSCEIVLFKSFKGIETKYCDYLSDMIGKRIVAVGPLVQEPNHKDVGSWATLSWLSQKRKYSTVYVAFGSEYFLSKDEINEIARGLELSNVNFLWVLRFPKGSNIELEEVLPKGYLERVSERGKVIQGWAPQAKILNHSAIGGFVSHCGWSSIMESMKFGVPIIAMPMHLDQPINARLVQEVGAGVEVVRDEEGKFQGEEIAAVIEKVLNEKDGIHVREKAQEMRTEIQDNGEKDIDRVEEELLKLCLKKKNGTTKVSAWSLKQLFDRFSKFK